MLLNTGDGDPQKTLDFLIRIRMSVMATASMPEDQNTLQGLINQASAAVAEEKRKVAVNKAKPIMVLEQGFEQVVLSRPWIRKEFRLDEIPYSRMPKTNTQLKEDLGAALQATRANLRRWASRADNLIHFIDLAKRTVAGRYLMVNGMGLLMQQEADIIWYKYQMEKRNIYV